MSSLIAAGLPANLRVSTFGALVTSDMFNICNRIRDEVEGGDRLYIYEMPQGAYKTFSVCELCDDQVLRFVIRCDELDQRAITACQRMVKIPFEKRFAEFEKIEAAWEAEEKQRKLDEMYENFGGQMWIDLERCGFITRPKSYSKRGVSLAAK